jgi:heme-degrading monooxygenase HmoA
VTRFTFKGEPGTFKKDKMENINQAFTTGIWLVKEGKEEEFIKQWTEFANWSMSIDNGAARLLQDADNPRRFVSVGKWSGEAAIQKWREQSQFKDAMARISDLLAEPAKPQRMKEVAHVGEHELV